MTPLIYVYLYQDIDISFRSYYSNRHDTTEIMLKVTLNTITHTIQKL